MDLQREYMDDGIHATVTTSPDVGGNIEDPITGSLKITSVEGVELPLTVRISTPSGYYAETSDHRFLNVSEFPIEVNLAIRSSDNRNSMSVRAEGAAGNINQTQLKLRPAQSINIANKILSDDFDGNNEEILEDIADYYGLTESLVYTKLRKDIRNHVGFNDYYNILDFLYKQSPHKEAKQHLVNSFEDHVVSEKGEYHPTSESEFESMLEFYSGLNNLPSFDQTEISEFKGYVAESFAKQEALQGNFDSAKTAVLNH